MDISRSAVQRRSYRTRDLAELEDFWRTTLDSRVVFDLSRIGPGQFHFGTAILDGVSTGRQRVNVAYTSYARTSESYIAWVNTRGRPVYQQGNLHYAGESDQIVTYRPGLLPQVATLDVGTELTYLALQPWTLERHLENLLEHQISGPIELVPLARMRTGAGLSWWRLLRMFNQLMLGTDSGMLLPGVIDPLCEALMSALLLSVDHQHREELAQPVPPARPRYVGRAVDAIHAHPAVPYTVSHLAKLAGVGIRTLQEGFRAHLHTTPMGYLREVRLTRAHEHLMADNTVTVAEVAHRWGFNHLGRFAASYAHRYGEPPSHTRR